MMDDIISELKVLAPHGQGPVLWLHKGETGIIRGDRINQMIRLMNLPNEHYDVKLRWSEAIKISFDLGIILAGGIED